MQRQIQYLGYTPGARTNLMQNGFGSGIATGMGIAAGVGIVILAVYGLSHVIKAR